MLENTLDKTFSPWLFKIFTAEFYMTSGNHICQNDLQGYGNFIELVFVFSTGLTWASQNPKKPPRRTRRCDEKFPTRKNTNLGYQNVKSR